MRRTQMATTPASRFGRAGFNPTAGFLTGKVTTEILEFVDERGGIGKTARTTPSPQSDGRSVSPARCFVTARDETGDIYAVDWRFFCFETALHDDPVAQTRGFLSRCEDALRCVGGLHAFKVGITRYPARRWNNKNFGYKFEGYQGMFMLSYAAMGAGALERCNGIPAGACRVFFIDAERRLAGGRRALCGKAWLRICCIQDV